MSRKSYIFLLYCMCANVKHVDLLKYRLISFPNPSIYKKLTFTNQKHKILYAELCNKLFPVGNRPIRLHLVKAGSGPLTV